MEGWAREEDEDMCDWTLGESIMRTLSRRDLLVIDIDNPQTQRSEYSLTNMNPRAEDRQKQFFVVVLVFCCVFYINIPKTSNLEVFLNAISGEYII